jgi:type IV pilus assembly protein PilC
MFGSIKLAERVQLFRELATLVNAGMSLGMALSSVEERGGGSVEQRVAIRDAARKVSSGKRFSEVMQAYPRLFSELNVALIAAGEQGGHLDEMLTTAADYLEREMQFSQTVARETAYPKVLLAALVFIPLGTKMIITGLTQNLGAALLVGIKFFALMALFIFVPLYFVYLAYRKYYVTEAGRLAVDRFKLQVPLVGAIITKLAWSRLCRALAALWDAGVNIREAVPIAARTASNRAIETALVATIPALERGEKLSEALAKTGMIPPLAMSMLHTGELTGNIDVTMGKVADYFEAEAHTTVSKLMVWIVPIAVLLAGVIVLFMLLGMYMGMYAGPLLNQ